MTHPASQPVPQPLPQIVGHRGARDLWAENSLSGFARALELGVDAIELDIHLTEAGELLVIHDATLDRTVAGMGAVRSLTPQARAALRLREADEGIPTLDEALALLAAHPTVAVHAEIKADAQGIPYPGLEPLVCDALIRHGLQARSLVTSFSPQVLAACRSAAPALPRLMSLNAASADRLGGLEPALAIAADLASVLAVHKDLLAQEAATILARFDRSALCVWVPNTEAELRHWLPQGYGFLTTDRPDLALALRADMADA